MHSFNQYVIDAEALVKSQTLKGFIKEMARQSNTPEAVVKYQVLNRQNVDEDYSKYKSPLYFGAGGEFLAEGYFDFFDSDYNLKEIVSMDDWDNRQVDRGWDHTAVSQKKQTYKTEGVISQPGSPVRIQTKLTENSIKQHMTNDGSRIMNFVGAALSEARKTQTSYSMRLILFTTGAGLHWALNDNTAETITVVNFERIKKKIDNNPFFWNHMRKRFGLPVLDIPYPTDPEGTAVKMELKALDN